MLTLNHEAQASTSIARRENYPVGVSLSPRAFSIQLPRRNTMNNFAYKTEDEVIDAAMHIMESKMVAGESFTSTYLTSKYFQLRLGSLEREVFSVMFLNTNHQLIATEDVFFGTIDGASVYPREVVKLAMQYNAAACVFSHNHPSGIVEPSEADKRITTRLVEALGLVGVRALDHIIVSRSQSMSFAERGLI